MTTKQKAMNKKISIYFVLLFTSIGGINAQDNFSFYNLGDYVAQTQNVSPVYLPKNSFTFGTPANIGLSLNAGFKVNELLVEGATSNTLKLDFNNLLASAEEKNDLNLDVTANIFMMAFKTKKGSISLFANVKATKNWQYSKDFLGVAANGISDFNLMNDKINVTAYSEIGIGITRKFINDRLAIGIRAKYLNGISHASTVDNAALSLSIDPATSAWTVTASDATVNTSQVSIEDGAEYSLFTGNTGFGFDFGATYDFTKKLTVEIAVNDIGSIDWSENIINYNIADQTSAVYSGVDLDTSGDIGDEIESALNAVIPSNETQKGFSSKLSTKSYLSAKYQLTEKNALRAVLFNNHAFGTFKPSYALGFNRTLNKTTYGILASTGGNNSEFKFGANIAFKLGPVQLYAATDSLAGAFGKPEEASGANVHFGLNLVFGYNKWIKKGE